MSNLVSIFLQTFADLLNKKENINHEQSSLLAKTHFTCGTCTWIENWKNKSTYHVW